MNVKLWKCQNAKQEMRCFWSVHLSKNSCVPRDMETYESVLLNKWGVTEVLAVVV